MTYKPVEGYCALYPEELKLLASGGTGMRSGYASAPCFAVYLALRLRAWNKKNSWWRCFPDYLTIAKDCGWADAGDDKLSKTIEARITRSLKDLRLMGMIVWMRGSKVNALANSYSLTFYKECRERRENQPTPMSGLTDTGVPTNLHPRRLETYTHVGPKNKENKNKKHSLSNERQTELTSAFQQLNSDETERLETAFEAFMGSDAEETTEQTFENLETHDYVSKSELIELIKETKDDAEARNLVSLYGFEEMIGLTTSMDRTQRGIGLVHKAACNIRWGL